MGLKKQSSLFRTIFTVLMFTALLPVTLLFLFQLYSVYQKFDIDSQALRNYHLESEKLKIKSKVDLLAEFINRDIQKMEENLKHKIQDQTSTAHAIADSIYRNNQGKLTDPVIKEMIKESLRQIRFNQDRGYFFITALDGTEILLPINPEKEGINLLTEGSPIEQQVTAEIVEIIKLWNESFYQYIWARPDNPKYEFHKISYLKRFQPYNWIIGTGDYLEELESAVQADVLLQIESLIQRKNNHIFVGQWDEPSLRLTPLTPEKSYQWEFSQEHEQRLSQMLVTTARNGGGFVDAEMAEPSTGEKIPKLIYVTSVSRWQWYIGSSVSTKTIEQVIAHSRQSLLNQALKQLLLVFLIMAVLLAIIFLFARHLANQIQRQFDDYATFFKNAANESIHLDETRTLFPEMLRLIKSVNKMIDIRQQSEKALQQSEEKFRGLTENVQDITVVTDPQGVIKYVNPAIQHYGSSSRNLIGELIINNLHPDDQRYFEEMTQKALNHPYETQNFNEVRFFTAPENEITLDICATYMPDTAGVNGVVLHSRDVTQRRKAEEARDEIEDRLDSFYKAAFEGIAISNEGILIDCNDQLTQILGYERQELIGKHNLEMIYDEDRPFVARMAQDKIDAPYQFRIVHKDGSIRYLETNSRSIFYHGKPARVSAIHDITENKKREEQQALQQQQLMQADKMISLGILTAGVAHEINNPNQFITSYLEPLVMAFNDAQPILDRYMEEHGDFRLGGANYSQMRERIPRYLNNISQGSNRIKTIVSELKAFSREDHTEQLEPLHINNVVQSALTLMKNLIKKTTDQFSLTLSEEIPPLQGHYQRLEQVIINLVQNACQALSGDNKTLKVTTELDPDKKHIIIKVSDNGCGISPKHLKRITDPFFTTKSNKEGIGLGLSISANIINEHSGQLVFTSEPEKGTTATVILPANQPLGNNSDETITHYEVNHLL